MQVFRRSSMVEQEAVNFEVAGSSPAVGAIEKALDLMVWGFFLCLMIDLSQQPQRNAMLGCGSIARSETEKFTFMDATKVRSCPAVGAKIEIYQI